MLRPVISFGDLKSATFQERKLIYCAIARRDEARKLIPAICCDEPSPNSTSATKRKNATKERYKSLIITVSADFIIVILLRPRVLRKTCNTFFMAGLHGTFFLRRNSVVS